MTIDQCQACGSSDIEELSGVPHPTCVDCGFVKSDDIEVPNDRENHQANGQEKMEWEEFYSVRNSTEQQVASGLEILETLCDELDLPIEARRTGADIFAKASLEALAKGRSMQVVVAASVCMSARQISKPRPVGTIATVAGIETSRLQRMIRLLHRTLDQDHTSREPIDYLPYLCGELSLSEDVEDEASRVLREYRANIRMNGKNPVGVAGAALYRTANRDVTQREVADTAGITQETIRVRLKEIREVLGETDE